MADLTVIPAQVRPIEPAKNDWDTVIVDQNTTKGQALYQKANGRWGLARGNAVGTAADVRIAMDDARAGKPVEAVFRGRVAGFDLTSLDPGTLVYLSAATAGALADTAPSGTGNVVVPVGRVRIYTNPDKTKYLYIDIPQNATPVALT